MNKKQTLVRRKSCVAAAAVVNICTALSTSVPISLPAFPFYPSLAAPHASASIWKPQSSDRPIMWNEVLIYGSETFSFERRNSFCPSIIYTVFSSSSFFYLELLTVLCALSTEHETGSITRQTFRTKVDCKPWYFTGFLMGLARFTCQLCLWGETRR